MDAAALGQVIKLVANCLLCHQELLIPFAFALVLALARLDVVLTVPLYCSEVWLSACHPVFHQT